MQCKKFIHCVLDKNKFLFEDLLSQEDKYVDSEDAGTTDTQSESNEPESDTSDLEYTDQTT